MTGTFTTEWTLYRSRFAPHCWSLDFTLPFGEGGTYRAVVDDFGNLVQVPGLWA